MNLNLDKEVENIINTNGFKIPREVLDNLSKKYDNRIVDSITNMVNNKHKDLVNNAIKLSEKLLLKGYTFTDKKLMKFLDSKKDKYMKKLNLNSANYETFISLVKKHLKKNSYEDVLPYNNIKSEFKKIFGEKYTVDNKSLYIDESEKPATNNILALHKNTHNLYKHVFLQSVSY